MSDKEKDPRNGAGDGKPPENTGEETPRTFTQDELDAILKDRLRRERAKFADYDDLRAKVEKQQEEEDKRKAAEMTAVEKLEKQLAELQAEKEQAEQNAQAMLIRMAVEREAIAANFHNPEDAYALADLSGLEVDDGKVDGAKEAIEALTKAKPHLVKKPAKPETDSGAGGTSNGTPDSSHIESIKRRFGLS